MKPNLLLITVDQMRGDCLGILGHPVVETPYLDTMARNGAVFTNAFSAVPSCIAARAAIFTGLSQRSHGRTGYRDGIPWNYDHTLAGELSKAGYHTQCVGKMHVHPARNLCGFHHVVLHDGYLHFTRSLEADLSQRQGDDYLEWLKQREGHSADLIDTGLECNSWVARPWMYPENLHPTNWVVDQSIDFLRRRDPTKPFFLMASFVRPHSPLDPPQAYFEQYLQQEISLPPVGDWAKTEDPERNGAVYNCQEGILDPRALKRARAAYYGCITHIDHQIGRLLQMLNEYGVLDSTIVLFTSDHGDLLGDHNLFRKALPYQGSVSVPFLIYDSGGCLGIQKGQRLENVVELRDIMPSLLDFAGVDIPQNVEGESLLPVLRGKGVSWREYIHGEHSYGVNSNHYITNGKEKYIWYSQTGREQFFNLEEDPEELRDLSGEEKVRKRIEYWRSILAKELVDREEGYSDGEHLIAGCEPKACLQHIL